MQPGDARIDEAKLVLRELGLPEEQQNDLSALVLLALADLGPTTPWARASTRPIRIHDMLGFIAEHYQREYAENTRESLRRQVVHQFIQAAVAVPNPDDPSRPTNSPNYNYALTDPAVRAIRTYGSSEWRACAKRFRDEMGALRELYAHRRRQRRVPVRLPNGEVVKLSPGEHNELEARVVEEFGSIFTPGAQLLYVGDTADKDLYLMAQELEGLGFPLDAKEKLPDVVLYLEERNLLVLVEAVTSHGPVTPKRLRELEEMLQATSADCVFVSAFPDMSQFKRDASQVAWETEVWIADDPTHIIHFNGDRFLP